MIIWKGRGFVVAIVAFGCLLLTEALTETHFRDDQYYQFHGWPKLAGFVIAAGIVFKLAGIGQPPVLRRDDSLFFVPVRFWPAILCALGIVFLFVHD